MAEFPNVFANYFCTLCGVKGDHWIMQCPNNDSKEKVIDLTISAISPLISGYTRKLSMSVYSDVLNLIELFHSKVMINNSYYTIKHYIQPLQPDPIASKWWEDLDDSVITITSEKWNTLDHNGVIFCPEYEPHGIPIKYDGEEIVLTPDQEEVATMFGVLIETDWFHKEIFRNNFMKEFKSILCDKNQKITYTNITNLDLCDFRAIYNWYQRKRDKLRLERKDYKYKQMIMEQMKKYNSMYGYAIVDGITAKIRNYKVAPPGLFRGRGEHPKQGRLKRRISPKDIILNIGENTPIPTCPISGQQWGGIIHDKTVTYIAKWVESINGQTKYVYLGASQTYKDKCIRNKYEKARLLSTKIDSIRKDYEVKLTSNDLYTKQLASAVWMVDKLGMLVGNEMDDNGEYLNDLGVCSLRKEHVILETNGIDGKYRITLDLGNFGGISTMEVPHQIWQNLSQFLAEKDGDENLFDVIAPFHVNNYLEDKMDGLNAKLFEIFNKSVTLENELTNGNIAITSSLQEKLDFYDECEMKALVCNEYGLRKYDINGMDPRITVAWSKRLQVPIDKIFNKSESLLDRFPWAVQCQPNYRFKP